jgi:hypothetical protein
LEKMSHPAAVMAGVDFYVSHTWYQRAVSKLYLPAYVALELRGGGKVYPIGRVPFKANEWQLGASGPWTYSDKFATPADVPTGTYKLYTGLVDDQGRPMINIASDRKDTSDVHKYSYYEVGTIGVIGK